MARFAESKRFIKAIPAGAEAGTGVDDVWIYIAHPLTMRPPVCGSCKRQCRLFTRAGSDKAKRCVTCRPMKKLSGEPITEQQRA